MAAAALPSATVNQVKRVQGSRWSTPIRRDDLEQGFLDALEVPTDAIVALHDAMFSCVVWSKIWEICEG